MSEVTPLSTDYTPEQAREFVAAISADVEAIQGRLISAYRGRAWLALGCESWDQMCALHFGGAVVQIPRSDRPELVAALVSEGMSRRSAAKALGVSEGTIRTDLAGAQNYAPATPVVGADGKFYPASRPAPPANVDRDTGEIAGRQEVPPVGQKLTPGIDTSPHAPQTEDEARAVSREVMSRHIARSVNMLAGYSRRVDAADYAVEQWDPAVAGENLRLRPTGARRCAACYRERAAAYRALNRDAINARRRARRSALKAAA